MPTMAPRHFTCTTKPIRLSGHGAIFSWPFQGCLECRGGSKHVRYPELMLSLQAEIYGLYHMTNPEVSYNREDLWTVATQTGMAEDGEQAAQAMEPNFVLMKLPEEPDPEFVEILPSRLRIATT